MGAFKDTVPHHRHQQLVRSASVIFMTTTLHTSCLDRGFSTWYLEHDSACLYRIVLFNLETVEVPVDILCPCSLVKVKVVFADEKSGEPLV
jgi:hypothetical protein